MAQQRTESAGTDATRRFIQRIEEDKDWNSKVEDVEVTTREVGTAVSSGYERGVTERYSDPVTDLKQRLSMWGKYPHLRSSASTESHRSQLSH